MNDHQPSPDPIPRAKPEPADASSLEEVVDDEESRRSWSDWAVDRMTDGWTAEEVAAEMVAGGWGQDEAEEIAEAARRATRHLRGVVTREEVAAQNAANYRKATALRWFTPIASLTSLWRLMNSLVSIRQAKQISKHRDSSQSNQPPAAPRLSASEPPSQSKEQP